ncbi:hypothetical protein ACTXT7_002860 [Hymenolepis weldensis]
MPKIVPAWLVFELTMPMQWCLLDHQKSNMLPKGITPKSSTKIKFPKCPGQCNHIRAQPMLVWRPKRSALLDDKCKEPKELVLLPDSAPYGRQNLGMLSQISTFSVRSLIFRIENGFNGGLPGRLLLLSMESRTSRGPTQSSAKLLQRIIQKSSEKIQGGTNIRIYG